MAPITFLLAGAALAGLSAAQFPPPRTGVTWVQSQHHPGISISYKDPQICETTPGIKSYSGYVHLPPNSINETGATQPYPINTFFWFVEARNGNAHRAPLSIWLNGGPGGSSLMGMLAENGPCWINADGNSSRLNEWAWNREVNMLFIDQPVQVGFSYDALYNGTLDLLAGAGFDTEIDENLKGPIDLVDFEDGNLPETNATFYVGTFASQNITQMPNSTEHSAVALWHFAQTWFEEFPEYKPHDEKISLWAESYGGRYGPSFMHFFQKQNAKIDRGEISGPGTHYLHLDTLGLINACIDDLVQGDAYSYFSWNNTYGIKAINETTKHRQLYELDRPGGLRDQLIECRRLSKTLESRPSDTTQLNQTYVESFCKNVTAYSSDILVRPLIEARQYGWFDITHPLADPFPRNHHLGWLNQRWVQEALGVPVNFTGVSEKVGLAFTLAGDMPRHGYLTELAHLLDHGVKVHLVYGDRDFACNWIGGEAASLAIPHKYQTDFAAAGYAPLTVAEVSEEPPFVPYGLTRQHGNLSFTRVFQAGHMVPSYQPEAALRIFERALFNKDIATGMVDLTTTGGWRDAAGESEAEVFSSKGTRDTWWRRNEVMAAPKKMCQIFSLMSCSEEEVQALRDGTAIVKDFVVIGIKEKETEYVERPSFEQDGEKSGSGSQESAFDVDEL